MGLPEVPYDILISIASCINDQVTLYNCLFVNRRFKDVAIMKLYETITLRSPRYYNGHLYLNALDTIRLHPPLRRSVKHVLHLPSTHDARASEKVDSGFEIPSFASLETLPNLRSYTFAYEQGVTLPPQYFSACTTVLAKCKGLQKLDLRFHLQLPHVKGLVPLAQHLSSLTVASVDDEEVLVALSSVIEGLTSFSMRDLWDLNFDKFIQTSACFRGLTSLDMISPPSYAAISSVLSNTPQLEHLSLFLTCAPDDTITSFSGLSNLQGLIMRHRDIVTKEERKTMLDWLALLVHTSPLTSFSLLAIDEKVFAPAHYLLSKVLSQKRQLTFINIPYVNLWTHHLERIFREFNELETLSFYVTSELGITRTNLMTMCLPRLSSLYIRSHSYGTIHDHIWTEILNPSNLPLFHRFGAFEKKRTLFYGFWTLDLSGERKGISSLLDEYGTCFGGLNLDDRMCGSL